MNNFNYLARTTDGSLMEGVQRAAGLEDAAGLLKKAGLTPVKIEPSKGGYWSKFKKISQISITSISETDRLMFARQMQSLLNAGLSVSVSLQSIARSTHSLDLKRALQSVAGDVESGHELTTALTHNGKLLPPLAIAIVHAGEQVGQLNLAFSQIAEQLEREQATRRDVWDALRYPLLVVFGLFIVLLVLNVFAIPAFQKIFSQLGTEMPWATQILVSFSNFISQYGLAILASIFLAICVFQVAIRFPAINLRWSHLKMNFPFVSTIFNHCMMSRFCSSLAMMVEAGVPLLRALNTSADVTGNSYFRHRMQHFQHHLNSGASIDAAARKTGLFTPTVLEMLAIGGDSGSLPRLLGQVGIYYETEARYQAKQLSGLIQPVLLVFLAAVIAVFGVGVYLPMLSMMTSYL